MPAPEKGYIDRLTGETAEGFGDTKRSLTTSAWAFGLADEKALAEDMAEAFKAQASKPKNAAQKEIEAAYKGVTNAAGVIDTTIAGAKALGTSIMNPKETSLEIARSAANSLPTMAGGVAGAGTGALAGAPAGVPGAVAGAIIGGRTGMMLALLVALGMNWADKDTNGLEALLVSLLSWANVGFLAMARQHGCGEAELIAQLERLNETTEQGVNVDDLEGARP